MFRALVLSIGLFICLVGIECLFVETAVLTIADFSAASLADSSLAPASFVISPPAWAPWGLLIGGSMVMIYSLTLTRRA